MGGHVVVHDPVQGTCLDAVAMGGVDLAFVADIWPARLLELGVEKDPTVGARLGSHHGFKFKVVPLAVLSFVARPEEVCSLTIDHQGLIFDGERFGVFGRLPAIQRPAIKKGHPISSESGRGKENDGKGVLMHGGASLRHVGGVRVEWNGRRSGGGLLQ